jgi:hypothetical protein
MTMRTELEAGSQHSNLDQSEGLALLPLADVLRQSQCVQLAQFGRAWSQFLRVLSSLLRWSLYPWTRAA